MKQTTAAAIVIALLATAVLCAQSAFAHEHAHHKKTATVSTEEHEFGREGDPGRVSRTIIVDMNDTMRFSPSIIRVRQGETVKFVVRNQGKAMHEMVLGTMDALKAHGVLMRRHPEMEHDEPYMAHVQPGGKEEMVWQFTKAGEFNFGCLAPGHLEAGMLGKIIVTEG